MRFDISHAQSEMLEELLRRSREIAQKRVCCYPLRRHELSGCSSIKIPVEESPFSSPSLAIGHKRDREVETCSSIGPALVLLALRLIAHLTYSWRSITG